jgi:hypothetical protein
LADYVSSADCCHCRDAGTRHIVHAIKGVFVDAGSAERVLPLRRGQF